MKQNRLRPQRQHLFGAAHAFAQAAGYFAALQTEEGFVTFCVTEKHTAQEVDEIIETVKAL